MDQYSFDDNPDAIRLRAALEQVLKRLALEVNSAWFERFLKPIRAVSLDNGSATLAVPGRFILDWIKEKYLATLEEMLSDELGEQVTVSLLAEPREREKIHATADVAVAVTTVEEPSFRPIEKYRFDSFVVGQSNRLAFAGAKAVADSPGQKFNPLFIYGPSGLGKTHLLHAIAREILSRDPNFPLVFVSAQQFSEEFVQALQTNKIEQFRRAQRNVGVWLLDDIQLVAGRDRTQEEIFHTFNYLQTLGKQIVLTSDRPPKDLHFMEDRLRSRFEAGLVADIQHPDTETRCAIVLTKAKQERVDLDVDVAMVLAENVPGNVRKLEGALTKLVVHASMDDLPITKSLAEEMVERYYRSGVTAKPSFDRVVDKVGKHFDIHSEEILGISRKAPIVHARHVAIYVYREITHDSWKHIGTLFGDRDHTSMMHGYNKIGEAMIRDRDLNNTVKSLIRELYPDA
ncbi:MAG: chromosomal replication initiator protein DnaA [Fimbriimonadales bacterium]